jgi:hypothetical protein
VFLLLSLFFSLPSSIWTHSKKSQIYEIFSLDFEKKQLVFRCLFAKRGLKRVKQLDFFILFPSKTPSFILSNFSVFLS